MTRSAPHTPRPGRALGLTLVESVVSVLLVGLVLIAALNTLGASRLTQSRSADQLGAALLATELLREAIHPPAAATSPVGDTRQGFDQPADYAAWSSTPPVDRDGVALTGAQGLTRSARAGGTLRY